MSAHLEQHRYPSGREFFIVSCQPCLAVLNSGHHYGPDGRHHAERLAAEHNAEYHEG